MKCIQQILIWFLVLFVKKSVFKSCQNVTMMCCYTGAGSLCQWHQKTEPECVAKCQVLHKPTLFCSSWVKSKPVWLHPVELTSDGEKQVICINLNGTTKWSIRIKLHVFCIVSPLASPVQFPIKFKRLLRYMQNVCKTRRVFIVCAGAELRDCQPRMCQGHCCCRGAGLPPLCPLQRQAV